MTLLFNHGCFDTNFLLMAKLIYEDETYAILGACFKIHNHFGSGFLEIVYKDALEIEFNKSDISFKREKEYPVFYGGQKLKHTFYADFILFDKIIFEVKSVSALSDAHKAQSINYLKVSNKKIALLVNFGPQRLEYQRFTL